MAQKIQKYRVDTDTGSYIVEVEVPSTPAEEPSSLGFLENVAESGTNLVAGAAKGIKDAVTQNPLTTAGNMIEGMFGRVKEYADDIHPGEAVHQLMEGRPGAAVANLLPVELMYRDPVGVAADVTGVAGVAKGAKWAAGAPGRRQARKAKEFNESPLAVQMDKLPERPGPERTRAGGPVASPRPTVDLSPDADRLRSTLNTTGGDVTRTAAGPSGHVVGHPAPVELSRITQPRGIEDIGRMRGGDPLAGQGTINDLPLWEQQRILERTTGGGPLDTGRKGGDAPPSREAAPPTSTSAAPTLPTTGRLGGHAIDLSVLPEATRTHILAQLEGTVDAAPPRPAAPTAPPPAAAPLPDAPPTLGDIRRLEEHGSGVAAADPRFREVAAEFGLPPTSSTVRDLTGGPSRTPLAAETAGLDADFTRRIMDEGGYVTPDVARVLHSLLVGYGIRGGKLAPRLLRSNQLGTHALDAFGAVGPARFNQPQP